MVEAGQTELIAIAGRIFVEPAKTPAGMTATEVAAASQRRLENVMVVLEHRRRELEIRLSAKSKALDPSIAAVTSQLTFAEKKPEFSVLFKAQSKQSSQLDSQQWKSSLPMLVCDTFSDLISEVSTSVGLWRVAIAVDPDNEAGAGAGSKAIGPGAERNLRLRYGLIGGLLLIVCAALFFFGIW